MVIKNKLKYSEINFIIKFEYPKRIPSVNSLYLSKRRGGRYLNPKAKAIKDFIKEETLKHIPKSLDTSNKIIKYTQVACFRFRFNLRDSSNTIKAVEDSVKESLGIDDSMNFIVKSAKIFNDFNKDEYISFNIKIFDKDSVNWRISEKM